MVMELTLAPPQTNSVWPVTKLLAGSAKNITARATSSERPSRLTGMPLASCFSRCV